MAFKLTKSDFRKYLQCKKYLWLHKNHKDLAGEISPATQAKFDSGAEVEEWAKKLFPGFVDAFKKEDPFDTFLTQKLVAQKTPIIYQPTFSNGKFFVRCDFISYDKKTETWDMYEVKGSSEIKEEQLWDIAFQKRVLEIIGLPVGKTNIIYVNRDYVRNGEIEPKELLIIENTDILIKDKLSEIEEYIKGAFDILSDKKEPQVNIVKQCEDPYECPFIDYCWKDIPDHSIYNIARLKEEQIESLIQQGIMQAVDIPAGFVTHELSSKYCRSLKSGTIIEKENIKSLLSSLEYPLYFLDYETYNPAVPIFDGFRPWQQIPFQYSLHILEVPGGQIRHIEFLSDNGTNPIKSLAESLKENIGPKGSVIVWSKAFEKGRNKEMGEMMPEYFDFFEDINNRVFDLMEFFSKGYYVDAEFCNSASIKKVLPVLIPALSYKELGIQEGGTASISWFNMINEKTPKEQKEKIKRDLLKYCKRDTEAMIEILKKLQRIVEK